MSMTLTEVEDAVDVVPPNKRHTIGRMVGLTMFTPIRPGYVNLIRGALFFARFVGFIEKHILQFDFIHFVRWAVVSEMPYNGAPQKRDKLRYAHLFFESNFDGPWQHYIDAFAYVINVDINFTWGKGFNFPGTPPAEPEKRWIMLNSLEGGTYYSAYPEASTGMVIGALAVHDGLRKLVAESRGLPSAEFKKRYEQYLTDVQAHL